MNIQNSQCRSFSNQFDWPSAANLKHCTSVPSPLKMYYKFPFFFHSEAVNWSGYSGSKNYDNAEETC